MEKETDMNSSALQKPAVPALLRRVLPLVVAAGVLVAMAAAITEFDLGWNTVDGGGGAASTGGGFSLAGTAGQHDAGTMTGGAYVLSGGFWSLPVPSAGCVRAPAWICDGDVDGNGAVNPVDVGLVQSSFCTPDDCDAQDLCQYDIDCNGAINPVDAGIVQSLFGACDPPRDVCP
jgi:hypothetical protein